MAKIRDFFKENEGNSKKYEIKDPDFKKEFKTKKPVDDRIKRK